jgi:putative transposase
MRDVNFSENEICHIYNQGVDLRNIFHYEADYQRFLLGLKEFNNESTREQRNLIKYKEKMKDFSGLNAELNSEISEFNSNLSPEKSFYEKWLYSLPKLVDIISYILNPNHYHLELLQLIDGGIKKFMHRIGTGYTNYYNLKYERRGALFQGSYKATKIQTSDRAIYYSAYINGNAQIHQITNDAQNYQWSSYKEYLGKTEEKLCDSKFILNSFENVEKYKNYVSDIINEEKHKRYETNS